MIKALANMLRKALKKPFSGDSANPSPGVTGDEALIYGSLAMTDEMREALFPTTPRMVSTIFERSIPSRRDPAPIRPSQTTPTPDDGFLII